MSGNTANYYVILKPDDSEECVLFGHSRIMKQLWILSIGPKMVI